LATIGFAVQELPESKGYGAKCSCMMFSEKRWDANWTENSDKETDNTSTVK